MVRYSEIGNKSDLLPLLTKWPFELIYFSKRKTILKAFQFQGPIPSTETVSFLINEFRKIELGKPALFLFLGELVQKKNKHSDLQLCSQLHRGRLPSRGRRGIYSCAMPTVWTCLSNSKFNMKKTTSSTQSFSIKRMMSFHKYIN